MASNFINPTGREALNDHKIDALSTKNNNMKQRRVVNAAPAVDSNDYVIKSQVDSVNTNLSSRIDANSKANTKLQGLLLDMVDYGTHARRLSLNTGKLPNGALYFETDRNNVEYQLQGNKWFYTSGTMLGTLSPDQRPTDLSTNDAGFMFQGTDTNKLYRWSGAAWVLETLVIPIPSIQYVVGTGNVNLTTSYQTVPGTQLTLTQPGTYLIIGVFYFTFNSGDNNNIIIGTLLPTQSAVVTFYLSESPLTVAQLNGTMSQNWILTISGSTNIALQAYKTGGSGTSLITGTQCTVTALWIHS